MLKVGLMTCYMDNFGACLQAYALQTVITNLGLDCEIIKYTPIKSLKEYGFLFSSARWIRKHIKAIKNTAYKYENYRHPKFKKFRKKYLKFSKTNYLTESSLYKTPPLYDVYIVGSDQIWNPNLYGGRNNRAYFLDFAPDNVKCIAYAPSIGTSEISADCSKDMAKLLAKFDAVSVREIDGKRIIDEVSDCGCRVVLDPTLLIDAEHWKLMIRERIIPENYIFVYLFGNRDYERAFIEYVNKSLNLKIVTIPFNDKEYNSNFMKIKKAGPLEFLNLIKYASLVITDSFHATAFSLNLNVPFYTLLRNTKSDKNNMNSRLISILSLVNKQDRIVSDIKSFPKDIILNMDFEYVNSKISELRKDGLQFLSMNIDK